MKEWSLDWSLDWLYNEPVIPVLPKFHVSFHFAGFGLTDFNRDPGYIKTYTKMLFGKCV